MSMPLLRQKKSLLNILYFFKKIQERFPETAANVDVSEKD